MSRAYGVSPREAPPNYTDATTTPPQGDAEFVDGITKWIPNPSTIHPSCMPRLEKPVVIPRIDISGRMSVPLPFMRAYSPDLRPYGVHEADFVACIDNLAVAQAPSAPLQVLDTAGRVVGMVPHHWATLAGAGMNVVAGAGTAAVSYGRTRYFLDKVNREYFAPRSLHMSMCKYQQLIEKLAIRDGAAMLGDQEPQAGRASIRDRCMSALQPYVASLSLDVPPPSSQRNVLDKIAAKGIEKKRQEHNKKQRNKSGDDGYRSDSSSSSSSSSSSDFSLDKGKAPRKAARRVNKFDRKAKKSLRKHPDRAAEIEEERARKVQEVRDELTRNSRKSSKKTTKRLKKDLDKVKRLEFVVVEALAEQHSVTWI